MFTFTHVVMIFTASLTSGIAVWALFATRRWNEKDSQDIIERSNLLLTVRAEIKDSHAVLLAHISQELTNFVPRKECELLHDRSEKVEKQVSSLSERTASLEAKIDRK